MIIRGLILVCLLAAAGSVLAADPVSKPPDLPPEGPEKSAVAVDPSTEHERRFQYLSIRDLTLEQTVEMIRKASHVNILIETWRLEAAGFDPKRTIRLYLEDVTWDAAFRAMLSAYGRDIPIALGERSDGQILVISTPDGVSNTLTRIYDVRQIVEYVQSASVGRPLGPQLPEELLTRQEMVERVMTMLEEAIDPDSWRDNGGSEGGMRELAWRLIITQTPANHKRIEKYLKDLEQELAKPMPPAASTQHAAEKKS
jgi:hypothetical protein